MATTINGTILVAGLTATGPKAHRIDGTYLIAGLSAVDGKTPVFLTLNNDGTFPGGGGSLPSGGTTAQFLRGDSTWSNSLTGPTLFPVGTAAAPSLAFSTATNTGFRQFAAASGTIVAVGSGTDIVAFNSTGVSLNAAAVFAWTSNNIGDALDSGFSRLGAASFALGNGTASDFSGTLKLGILNATTAVAIGGALTTGVTLQVPIAPTATPNYGLVSVGGGPWDGSTSGFFAGNSNGTHLAFNTIAGYAGRIIDARQAGVRQFAIGLGTVASATSANLNGVDIAPFTYTISGNTAITTATGFNAVTVGIPTYSAVSAVAITIGATLAIAGAPAVAGSATLTTPLAVWVQAGTSRFDGNLMLSSDNTVQRIGAHSLQFGAANNASPVSYTLTGGESARGGTDTNTAGGSLTIASGAGTGTGAVTSIVFQTPTVGTTGTTAQTLATRLTINSTGISIVGQLSITSTINVSSGGLFMTSAAAMTWPDLAVQRVGAHSLQLGAANNATPVAYTLTIGESSRSGTDSNTPGASGTLQPGAGTGTGTLASLSLASPIAAASGTTAQTYATGLKILVGTAVLTNYIVANLPAAATAGAGATAFVTDGSTTVILGLGQAVTGGGANKVPVYSDGTNWIIG